MKVLYTFGGMPHYLNAMLNKLLTKEWKSPLSLLKKEMPLSVKV